MQRKVKGVCILACMCIALGAWFAAWIPTISAAATQKKLTDDVLVRKTPAVVYVVNPSMTRLLPQAISLDVLPGETLLEALVQVALIGGAQQDIGQLYTKANGFGLISIEHMGNVATINLSGQADLLTNFELFVLKAALVNTLVETGEIYYVNILFSGREVSTNRLPTGTMVRFSEDLQTAWAQHENEGYAALRSEEYAFKRYITLFFLSTDTDLLLAEIREVTSTAMGFSRALVEETIKGPSRTDLMRRAYPVTTTVIGQPVVILGGEEGSYLDVSLSYEFGADLPQEKEQRRIALSPLVLTMTTCIPDLDAMNIRVNRRPIESVEDDVNNDRLFMRYQFEDLVGRTIELFYPKQDGRLYRVSATLPHSNSALRDLVCALINRQPPPVDGVLPVFPEGFNPQSVLGVAIVDDIAIVNLSAQGAQILEQITQ